MRLWTLIRTFVNAIVVNLCRLCQREGKKEAELGKTISISIIHSVIMYILVGIRKECFSLHRAGWGSQEGTVEHTSDESQRFSLFSSTFQPVEKFHIPPFLPKPIISENLSSYKFPTSLFLFAQQKKAKHYLMDAIGGKKATKLASHRNRFHSSDSANINKEKLNFECEPKRKF